MGNGTTEATERLRRVKEMTKFRANLPVHRFDRKFSPLSVLMTSLTTD